MTGPNEHAVDRSSMVTIVSSSPMPTLLFDLNGVIHAASPAAEVTLGAGGAAGTPGLVGRRVTDLMEDPAAAQRVWSLLVSGDIDGYWRRIRLLRKDDGSRLRAEVWVSADAAGGPRRFAVAVLLPATSPAASRTLVEAPPADEDLHLLGVVNGAWEVNQISCTVTDLFGYRAEDVIGKSILQLVHPSDIPELIMTLGTAAGLPRMSQTRLRLQNAQGGWQLYRARITPLAGADLPSFAFMAQPERADRDEEHRRPSRDAATQLMQLAHELRLKEGQPLGLVDRTAQDRDLLALSRREREIVDLLLLGERAPDIARILVLSQSTVRNHLASAFKKVGVHSQQELMRRFRTPGR